MIQPFLLERYFAKYEFKAQHLLCCSDCESLTIDELLNLSSNDIDTKNFNKVRLGYTETRGHSQLCEEIARLYGPGIHKEHILVHSGAEEAIFNVMHATLQKGDHVIVHMPCYQSLIEVPRYLGCDVTPWFGNAEKGWALDLDFLKKKLKTNTKLVVINFPHNPTGFLMEKKGYQELTELSIEKGFLLFSDEVYRFLEYNNKNRLSPACEIGEKNISLGVMSKSFGLAGLRIGWIATRNPDVYQKTAGFKDYTTICNSAPSEYLATVALRNKDIILKRNLKIVMENLSLLKSFFNKFPDLFKWQAPIAGPIAFPELLKGSVDSFCQELVSQQGVLLLPGTLYEPKTNHFRIGFGRKSFKQGLDQFELFLKTWKPK